MGRVQHGRGLCLELLRFGVVSSGRSQIGGSFENGIPVFSLCLKNEIPVSHVKKGGQVSMNLLFWPQNGIPEGLKICGRNSTMRYK